ncbi:MAG: hypothetical protein ABI193_02175 [Minicystis sp.]
MKDPPALKSPTGATYRCSACSRCFIAVNVGVGHDLLCICGGSVLPCALPRWIYELNAQEPCDSRMTIPGADTALPEPTATQEADLGYGASHGNDPSHSGPTGPGDAPANDPKS